MHLPFRPMLLLAVAVAVLGGMEPAQASAQTVCPTAGDNDDARDVIGFFFTEDDYAAERQQAA